MKKLLVVVDMQNDFIDGALGTPEAQAIVPKVIDKINNWDGDIWYTQDTHHPDYLSTNEGKHLPVVHCIRRSHGWEVQKEVDDALRYASCSTHVAIFEKGTFGSYALAQNVALESYNEITLIGLCTDICVVTNALLLKTVCSEAKVVVDASCCAGVTPESHKAALLTMKMCQVDVIGEDKVDD